MPPRAPPRAPHADALPSRHAPRLVSVKVVTLYSFGIRTALQRSRVTRPVVSRATCTVLYDYTVRPTAGVRSALELDRPSSQQDPGAGRARLAPGWTAPFSLYHKVLISHRVRSSSDSRTALDVLRLPAVAGPASGPRPSQLSQSTVFPTAVSKPRTIGSCSFATFNDRCIFWGLGRRFKKSLQEVWFHAELYAGAIPH